MEWPADETAVAYFIRISAELAEAISAGQAPGDADIRDGEPFSAGLALVRAEEITELRKTQDWLKETVVSLVNDIREAGRNGAF